MSNQSAKKNLDDIYRRIAAAAAKARRDPADIRLVAVTKTVTADIVQEAYHAGHRAFGENRVQEMTAKATALPDDIEWHFIGHLQKNKVRHAVQTATWIHSVDSMSLLKRIDRIAGEEQQCPILLIEVNVSGEESKYGVPPETAGEIAAAAGECTHAQLRGLMTMAPFGASPDQLHIVFGRLRDLRDRLQDRLHAELPELSMGMSADFEAAIVEGATLVRVGSAIFGNRHIPQ